MIQPKRIFLFHLTGIVIFLFLPVILSPRPEGIPLLNLTQPAIRDLLTGAFMIAFFYANYYLFTVKLFLEKKYLLYGLVILSSFLVILLLPSLILGHIPWNSSSSPSGNVLRSVPPENGTFILSISHNILLFLSVIFFSIFLRMQERLYKAERAKNQMEILSLKDQINPHFLFNTLNNIYGQAIHDNAHETASSILKLSGMLRHVVHEAENDRVTLKKELEYLENYIQLQRQRLGSGIELNYLIKGTPSAQDSIAPLILIPFIENAFKHGVNPDEKSHIQIEISIHANALLLFVKNKKVGVRLEAHEQSGAGMNITLNRLKLLYPNRHDLTLDNGHDYFTVKLELELHD